MNIERFLAINGAAAEAASRALTRMLERKATVKLLSARFIGPETGYVDIDPEEVVEGVCFSIIGGLRGAALLCFPAPKARALAEILVGHPGERPSRLALLDESALKELGNIICGNYVTALSNALHVKVIPGVPHRSRGMFGSMFEQVIARRAQGDQVALLVDVELSLPEGVMMGHLLLCLDAEKKAERA